jgi:hypothetical protein
MGVGILDTLPKPVKSLSWDMMVLLLKIIKVETNVVFNLVMLTK